MSRPFVALYHPDVTCNIWRVKFVPSLPVQSTVGAADPERQRAAGPVRLAHGQGGREVGTGHAPALELLLIVDHDQVVARSAADSAVVQLGGPILTSFMNINKDVGNTDVKMANLPVRF
jgi:hypothetical protein